MKTRNLVDNDFKLNKAKGIALLTDYFGNLQGPL